MSKLCIFTQMLLCVKGLSISTFDMDEKHNQAEKQRQTRSEHTVWGTQPNSVAWVSISWVVER